MGLQLLKIDDPRDALERARKPELLAFARANGLGAVITDAMPAMLMRRELRRLNITRITVPQRTLGMSEQASRAAPARPSLPSSALADDGPTVDAEDDLARQLAAAAAVEAATKPKTLDEMTYNELRKEGVRLGARLNRSDRLEVIREKVRRAREKAGTG